MRTPDEIAAMVAQKRDEFLSFWPDVLSPYLPYHLVQPFLKEGVTATDWEEAKAGLGCAQPSDAQIKTEMQDYMAFAWEKALGHRGLSASRSVDKLRAWCWLLNDPTAVALATQTSFPNYGVPILAALCEHFGWPIPDSPAVAHMRQGRPCHPGCEEGCGR